MTTPVVCMIVKGQRAKFRCKADIRYDGEGTLSSRGENWRSECQQDAEGFYVGQGLPRPRIVILEVLKGEGQAVMPATA